MRTHQMGILRALAVTTVTGMSVLSIGCASTPRETRALVNNEEVAQDFAQLRIRDIAVMPVRTSEDVSESVGQVLRDEIKRSLIGKLYSPLSFDSIDKKLGPVAERRTFDPVRFKGSFDEDAILTAELTQWDEQWLRSNNQVLMGAKLSLYHCPTGKVVWSRELKNKQIDVSGTITAENARAYEDDVVRKFVREAMRGLPRKSVTGDADASTPPRN
jgi:hypothetical protein